MTTIINTSYDEIFMCFLDNCGYNKNDIPTSDTVRYQMIKNAVNYYNNKIKKYENDLTVDLVCDDLTETLNVKLNSDELLILANILKLIFLKNKESEFVGVFSVFQKELGINNYKAQADSRARLVKEQELEIDNLILNVLDNWEI